MIGVNSYYVLILILLFRSFGHFSNNTVESIETAMNDTLSTDDTTDKSKFEATKKESEKRCATMAEPLLQQRVKIILMGDSITQMSLSATLSGWGTHLADLYQRRADVYNRGFSGYNTDWFLKYLETDKGRRDLFFKPSLDVVKGAEGSSMNIQYGGGSDIKLVTIFFGANDAADPVLHKRHHVPLIRFQANLHTIASLCRQNYGPDVHILFITPPPVHHASRLKFQIEKFGKEKATGKLERSLELSGKYASAVETVANQLGMPCLNLWKKMQEAMPSYNIGADDSKKEGEQPWKLYLSDGLHLSREGNIFVGNSIKEMIRQHFPDITVSVYPSNGYVGGSASKGGNGLGGAGGLGPWHDEIDYENPHLIFQTEKKRTTG